MLLSYRQYTEIGLFYVIEVVSLIQVHVRIPQIFLSIDCWVYRILLHVSKMG